MRGIGFLAWLLICSSGGFGQQLTSRVLPRAGNAKASYPLPVKTIDLDGKGQRIVGLLNTNSMGYPVRGSSDGTIFAEMYDESKQPPPFAAADLYAISEDAKVTKIQRKLPNDIESVQFTYLYAGESEIASLLSARPRRKDANEPAPREIDYFICLSKRDGTFDKLISLKDLKLQPFKIAVLVSGKFLVAGVDKLNKTPVLAMLDSDGEYLRPITFDNRPLDSSKSLQAIYQHGDPGAGPGADAVSAAAFVPYGNRVLFYIPGSKLPVRILGEGGEENSIQLHLPGDYLIETILPCAKNDTWVVRTQPVNQLAQLQSMGMVSTPKQQLFEVDPFSGKAIRKLEVAGVHPGQVASAANKKLIALRQTGDMQKEPAYWSAVEQDR